MDHFSDAFRYMAGTYEKALGLQSRGKDSAGRFYSAMAEKEFYLEVFPYCAEHDYKLDKNGVVRVGR